MKAVIADNLVKGFGTKKAPVEALRGVSFTTEQGELFGIIGPDGAGKTTLFRVLTTLLLPDKGVASVDGYDVVKDFKKIRKTVGYMPGKFSLYQDLTIAENLDFFATIFHTSIKENYDLIRDIYVQIEPFKNRKAGKLSGGMKQKLALCCALIHRPSVLFLDEPTTGVDAVSRKEFWEMLRNLKVRGISILVSTPYMDEAGLCDKVALVQSGKIMSIDTPAGIASGFKKTLLAAKSSNMGRLLKDIKQLEEVEDAYPFGEYHHVIIKNRFSKNQLRDYLDSTHPQLEIKEVQPGIEDCFMELMKEDK